MPDYPPNNSNTIVNEDDIVKIIGQFIHSKSPYVADNDDSEE